MACNLGCPDYVLECFHFQEWVIWRLEKQAMRGELDKRGILGTVCPQCGRKESMTGPMFVMGPGILETPDCLCSTGLNVYNLDQNDVSGGSEMLMKVEFERRVRWLMGLAPTS